MRPLESKRLVKWQSVNVFKSSAGVLHLAAAAQFCAVVRPKRTRNPASWEMNILSNLFEIPMGIYWPG